MILEWVDKKDGDYIDPNDINKVAKGVQSLEELIDDTRSSSVQKTTNGSSIYATNEQGEAITVRYAPNAEADTVAYRDENGNIGVGSPVQEQDAANKQYVDSVKIGLENSVANALKGNVSGETVRVDDASPITHKMSVKVSGVNDVGAVKVLRFGKNLCDNVFESGGINQDTGANISVADSSRSVNYHAIKPNTSYTISKHGVDKAVRFRFYDKDKNYIGYKQSAVVVGTSSRTFTSADNARFVRFDIKAPVGDQFLLQLELGEATDFEPYVEPTEYAVNEDGTVDDVTALYPTTTLMTDTAGAVIECEYSRDINKAFAELQQAIISMGGNV